MHITTKEQERVALSRIREILETLEPGSYVRMAITENVLRMAADNIEYDFGNSPDDQIEHWQKTASEYREELFSLKEENARLEASTTQALECANTRIKELERNMSDFQDIAIQHEEERDAMTDSYNQLRSDYEELERRVRETEDKNIRLKAKLYDMMTAKEVR